MICTYETHTFDAVRISTTNIRRVSEASKPQPAAAPAPAVVEDDPLRALEKKVRNARKKLKEAEEKRDSKPFDQMTPEEKAKASPERITALKLDLEAAEQELAAAAKNEVKLK